MARLSTHSTAASSSESRTTDTTHLNGRTVKILASGSEIEAFQTVHDCGSGPGLLLISDINGIDASLRKRAELFGAEGYSVIATGCDLTFEQIAAIVAHLRACPETDGEIVAVGHGHGAMKIIHIAALARFCALVAFDALELEGREAELEGVPCPFVLQFGSLDAPPAKALAKKLKALVRRKDGSKVFEWSEAAPGFALPLRATSDKRVDSLAPTRTLELVRRVVGPYYDFAALFAEHTYHEFTTKDVDATMETMIDEPYVNHVPTLAGGVGHDMLKRFYKYNFVEQNAGGRDRRRVSYTLGSDRVVLESYTKFRHDCVIDRYFPGIAPTGKVVEIATVIIVKFRGDKVCHEHLYWDQGSALKQIGMLQADGLPIAGAEAARKVLDESLRQTFSCRKLGLQAKESRSNE